MANPRSPEWPGAATHLSMEREVDLVIEDIAFGGQGVGRCEGKVVFVPFTIAGERAMVRIVREKKSSAEAELVSLLETSPYRTEPLCPYFGRCGGCSYQHIAYEHQLHWKSRQVAQALKRLGKIAEPPLRPIVPSPRDYEYRNRITVHVDRGTVGFFRNRTHRLIDIERCVIAEPEVNAELTALRARRPRDGHYTLRSRDEPRVFSQTNELVANHLADAVAALVPARHKLVIDAYCGAGFFAKRIAVASGNRRTTGGESEGQSRTSMRCIGIDWDVHAIAAAQATGSAAETYIAGDIATQLREQLEGAEPRLTTVIVDPPAVGLSAEVRKILRTQPVATLIYVSCNPPTLARDLADLAPAFHLESATPFDMFPQTSEIEVLAHLAAA
jgi:23S rRNA (uracil1939-C5)-methyltransferase